MKRNNQLNRNKKIGHLSTYALYEQNVLLEAFSFEAIRSFLKIDKLFSGTSTVAKEVWDILVDYHYYVSSYAGGGKGENFADAGIAIRYYAAFIMIIGVSIINIAFDVVDGMLYGAYQAVTKKILQYVPDKLMSKKCKFIEGSTPHTFSTVIVAPINEEAAKYVAVQLGIGLELGTVFSIIESLGYNELNSTAISLAFRKVKKDLEKQGIELGEDYYIYLSKTAQTAFPKKAREVLRKLGYDPYRLPQEMKQLSKEIDYYMRPTVKVDDDDSMIIYTNDKKMLIIPFIYRLFHMISIILHKANMSRYAVAIHVILNSIVSTMISCFIYDKEFKLDKETAKRLKKLLERIHKEFNPDLSET